MRNTATCNQIHYVIQIFQLKTKRTTANPEAGPHMDWKLLKDGLALENKAFELIYI